ncbi:MAG: Sir2 family NAD-dependent protein deacetylase [Saprospiraceae bacterium]
MQKIVVLTGAGMSAESGISTFRDTNGLWENHRVEDVASPEGWLRNPELVLNFYNIRRRQLKEVEPNTAHLSLVRLEKKFDLQIITQNVDNLHERAGSSKVLHLHGELTKVRSTGDPRLIYEWDHDLNLGDKCQKGFQLRPHIVWFSEEVPNISIAAKYCNDADILIIIGTSMQVYPAASLLAYSRLDSKIYFVDPSPNLSFGVHNFPNLEVIRATAGEGVPMLVETLLKH